MLARDYKSSKNSVSMGAKEDHLNKSIDMDEGIRQVKVEQLTNLMQSNLGMNSTITTDIMGKWE